MGMKSKRSVQEKPSHKIKEGTGEKLPQVRQMEKGMCLGSKRGMGDGVAYLSQQVLVQAMTSQQHLALVLATLQLKVLALPP